MGPRSQVVSCLLPWAALGQINNMPVLALSLSPRRKGACVPFSPGSLQGPAQGLSRMNAPWRSERRAQVSRLLCSALSRISPPAGSRAAGLGTGARVTALAVEN